MPNSVRCIIKKCLHKGAINQKECDKIMRKLDGCKEEAYNATIMQLVTDGNGYRAIRDILNLLELKSNNEQEMVKELAYALKANERHYEIPKSWKAGTYVRKEKT